MAREVKIPAVKIEFGKDNRVIIRVPYNQELIKENKNNFWKKMESKKEIFGFVKIKNYWRA